MSSKLAMVGPLGSLNISRVAISLPSLVSLDLTHVSSVVALDKGDEILKRYRGITENFSRSEFSANSGRKVRFPSE